MALSGQSHRVELQRRNPAILRLAVHVPNAILRPYCAFPESFLSVRQLAAFSMDFTVLSSNAGVAELLDAG